MQTLTSKKYWENYYSTSQTGENEIIKICSVYDNLFEKLIASCSYPPMTIIEIGAYPGRFLAYLSAKYSLEATALDYNPDKNKILESFSSTGGLLKEIIQADFIHYEPLQNYDLILSNGFIEHFLNYDEILDRHVRFMNKGGAMLIIIPNKRYLRKWYGFLVDRENLKAHNLKCMKLKVFREFARRNGLLIKYLSYYGGFAYKVHQELNLFQKIVYKIIRAIALILKPFIESHPNSFWSGSIVGIFQKPNV